MSISTGTNSIDALVYSSWNSSPGTAAALTYSFLASPPSGASADDAKGFQMMTFAQQQATRAALGAWSAVANLSFVEVEGGGQLRFGTNDQSKNNSSAYAYLPEPGVDYVALYLNNRGYYNSVFTPGSSVPPCCCTKSATRWASSIRATTTRPAPASTALSCPMPPTIPIIR